VDGHSPNNLLLAQQRLEFSRFILHFL
jgi:hypothetical protein